MLQCRARCKGTLSAFGIRVPLHSFFVLPIAHDDVGSLSVYKLPVLYAAQDTFLSPFPPSSLFFPLLVSLSRPHTRVYHLILNIFGS